jgi:hypothetical protein
MTTHRLLVTLAACLSTGCAATIDPATGKETAASQARRAAIDRVGTTLITVAEAAAVAKINEVLKVKPQK